MSDDERAALLAVLESAPAAIAIHRGPALVWELANARYRTLLGGKPLVGRALAEVLPDWAQLRRILEEVARTGRPFVAREHRFLVDPTGAGDLSDAWFDVICQPLGDGAPAPGVLSFAIDVTAQVEARQRAESAAAKLSRAVDARDEFLSVASHELKTPLTALRLQVQALQRALARAPDRLYTAAELRARIDTADRQVNRLVELTEALLDVSRLQSGRVDLRIDELDLGAIAAEVVDRARPAAHAAGSTLTLVAPAPPRGRWDRSRLDQVLTNLVSNAIKYGDGKPIEVHVEALAGEPRARIVVVDQGIGIAPEDQARIFERFERAVSRTNFAGLGLGLWISRRIARALGGDVTVESAAGAGARFTFWLPLPGTPER